MIKPTRELSAPGRPGIPESIKDSVVSAFNAGTNCQEITKQYKISKSSFYRIIKERQEVCK